MRELLAAEEVADEFLEPALDLGDVDLAVEHGRAAARDGDLDGPGAGGGFGHAGGDPRADGAGAVVDLGLREVEEVFALDVARAHVVADGEAGEFAAGIEHEGQLGLGHVPLCVGADANLVAGADGLFGHGFEEEFRPGRVIHAVVGGGAEVAFLHAGGLAAEVGDAHGPDLLPVDGREEFHVGIGEEQAARIAAGEALDGGGDVLGFEKFGDGDAAFGAEVDDVLAFDEADAHGAVLEGKSAEVHVVCRGG